jgi:hypothetical protein
MSPPPRYLYQYVGPPEIANAVNMNSHRVQIASCADVRRWIATSFPPPNARNRETATFIVDENGHLWIADRRSEHVACARGGRVLSAGEITFEIVNDHVAATFVTNQSTGYCPQPESWSNVAAALDKAGIDRFDDFDARYEFRRCGCGQINIVKNGVFECSVCGAELPRDWNFA